MDAEQTHVPPLPPGYRWLRRLGAGNSGVVELALRGDSRVAYKWMPGLSPAARQHAAQRFSMLSQLRHDNLLRLIEPHFEHDPAGFSMELVDGPDFVSYVRGSAAADDTSSRPARSLPMAFGQPLTEPGHSVFRLPESAGFGRLRSALCGLARGLAALHAAGFVHRDVSPGNVRVRDGQAVLLDYELAIVPGDASEHEWVGTAAYMAPEQWEPERVGPPADLYAVGLVMFEALTGALPFSGSAEQVFVSKRTVGAPRISGLVEGVPADLDEICAALLRTSASQRPTAAQLAARLEHDETLDVTASVD